MATTKIPLALRPKSRVLPLTAKFCLADYELVRAEAASHGMPVSKYIREKTLSGTIRPPTVINPICQEQWRELARLAGNLNRLLYLLNTGATTPELATLQPVIEAAKAELRAVRDYLVGASAA